MTAAAAVTLPPGAGVLVPLVVAFAASATRAASAATSLATGRGGGGAGPLLLLLLLFLEEDVVVACAVLATAPALAVLAAGRLLGTAGGAFMGVPAEERRFLPSAGCGAMPMTVRPQRKSAREAMSQPLKRRTRDTESWTPWVKENVRVC